MIYRSYAFVMVSSHCGIIVALGLMHFCAVDYDKDF